MADVSGSGVQGGREGQSAYFTSLGQRVRYRVQGDGPPLLMIHGIGAPLELRGPLEPKLAADFQTITVDPPGAGHSSTPEGRFRMPEFAQVLDDLLTHLRLPSANVFGLSLGGMMAQELAHRSPHRIDQLVLASTSIGWNANPRTSALLTARALRRERRLRKQEVRGPSRGDRKGEDEFSLLRTHWELRRTYRPSARGYRLGLAAAWTWTSRPWLRRLAMPVLAIHGSDDPLVPVANSRIIASTVQNGRLEIFERAGHLAVLRDSGRAARLIREFLQRG